jgi:hypothetical protein
MSIPEDNIPAQDPPEPGNEELRDAAPRPPHIHDPDCKHCSDHEELTDEDDDDADDDGEQDIEVDVFDAEITIHADDLNNPLSATFAQFLESIVTDEDDEDTKVDQDDAAVHAVRVAYMAGALDALRLMKSGVIVQGKGGEYLAQGYSLMELGEEAIEELGLNEPVDEDDEEDKVVIEDSTKAALQNIIDKKL